MSAFTDWMIHTVNVLTPDTAGDWGGVTSTPHNDVPCRIEDVTETVTDASGVEFASSTRLHIDPEYAAWFPPGASVHVRDRDALVGSIDVVDEGDPDLDGATVFLR